MGEDGLVVRFQAVGQIGRRAGEFGTMNPLQRGLPKLLVLYIRPEDVYTGLAVKSQVDSSKNFGLTDPRTDPERDERTGSADRVCAPECGLSERSRCWPARPFVQSTRPIDVLRTSIGQMLALSSLTGHGTTTAFVPTRRSETVCQERGCGPRIRLSVRHVLD